MYIYNLKKFEQQKINVYNIFLAYAKELGKEKVWADKTDEKLKEAMGQKLIEIKTSMGLAKKVEKKWYTIDIKIYYKNLSKVLLYIFYSEK